MALQESTADRQLRALQSGLEHNTTVLMSLMKTIQEVQNQGMDTSKRLRDMETTMTDLYSLTSAAPSQLSAPVAGSGPRKEELLEVVRETADQVTSLIAQEMADLKSLTRQQHRDVTGQLSSVKEVVRENTSQVMTLVTDEMAKVSGISRQQQGDVIARIDTLESAMTSQLSDLTSSVDEVKSKLGHLGDRIQDLELSNVHISDKLSTLTDISIYCNIKLKEETTLIQTCVVKSTQNIKQHINRQTQQIIQAQDNLNTNMSDNFTQLVGMLDNKLPLLDDLSGSVKSLTQTADKQLTTMNDIAKKTQEMKNSQDTLKTDMNDRFTTLTGMIDRKLPLLDDMSGSVKSLTQTADKQLTTMNDIKSEVGVEGIINTMMRDLHGAVVDQIVAELQLCREVSQSTRNVRSGYTCDLFVTNWSKWVGTGRDVFSRLWYIDQARTHVKGGVGFVKGTKKMSVWLVQGRYPRVLGMEAAVSGVDVRVKVTVMRQRGAGDNWELGSEEMSTDETGIDVACDGWEITYGRAIASDVSCDEVKNRGLVYLDRVLFRYELTVL